MINANAIQKLTFRTRRDIKVKIKDKIVPWEHYSVKHFIYRVRDFIIVSLFKENCCYF